MNNKPIIAITGDINGSDDPGRFRLSVSVKSNYAEQVSLAGGCPIIIPPSADMSQIAELIDGWLLPGGNDMDASHFGEANHEEVCLAEPERFEMESALFAAVNPDLPIFGICYGCQYLNVAFGGSLVQHLGDVVPTIHNKGDLQTYVLDPGSLAERALGSTVVKGKSYHHQAVGRLGNGVIATGHHEDGTIEAIEVPNRHWVLGLQWHPERTPDDKESISVFRSFVQAAARYRAQKSKESLV